MAITLLTRWCSLCLALHRFKPAKVKELIHNVLTSVLLEKTYESEEALEWTQTICDSIREQTKGAQQALAHARMRQENACAYSLVCASQPCALLYAAGGVQALLPRTPVRSPARNVMRFRGLTSPRGFCVSRCRIEPRQVQDCGSSNYRGTKGRGRKVSTVTVRARVFRSSEDCSPLRHATRVRCLEGARDE